MAMQQFVTVASKLSFSLVLSVDKGGVKWVDYTMPNGMIGKMAVPGERVTHTVRGFQAQRRLERDGQAMDQSARVIGGYGLTENIPADFWDQWLAENDQPGSSFWKMLHPPSGEPLIFAHSRQSYVVAQAKERAKTRSGTEALTPQTFDRSGKRTSEPDDRIPASVMTADRAEA